MASLQSRLLRLFFRFAIRRPLDACDTDDAFVATARRTFELGASRNVRVPSDTRVVPIDAGGVCGEWVLPRDMERVERTVLYVHGGAFVACRPLGYRRFAAALARASNAAVFVLDYRRAPEHRFPAALDDAIAAYDALRLRLGPERIVFAGDSAGGNLALATLLALRARRNDPKPVAGVVVLSPWTDLTNASPSIAENAASEDMIGSGSVDVARLYAGDTPLDDPLVSPVNGDYTGGPPMLAFASTIEILRDDAVRVVARARREGVDAHVELGSDMPHVWPIFGPILPESRVAFRQIVSFVERCWATA
jgi:monoterpene epsilon-lactone hydrolase